MTPGQLRAAGYSAEAERLEAVRAKSVAWAFRPSEAASYRALAVSLFGSSRFNELADAIGVDRW